MLGVVIAGAFWVKNQYPASGVARVIECLLAQGLALIKKPAQQDADTPPASYRPQESVNSLATQLENSALPGSADDKEKPGVAETPLSEVPEDFVLRRHYFATQTAERAAITHPYPTDSVLRRHHESRQGTLSVPSVALAEPAILSSAGPAKQGKVTAPEDHVLKRHFLTQLRAEVEAAFLPRPTDSTLLRHYESLVLAEVAARLQAVV